MRRLSLRDTTESVFSSMFHLAELGILDINVWTNLKQKMEEAIDTAIEEVHSNNKLETAALSDKIHNYEEMDNAVHGLGDCICYLINRQKFIKNKEGQVFIFNNDTIEIEDTHLPEKADIVYIDGDNNSNVLKAICNKNTYIFKSGSWKLEEDITNKDIVEDITYIVYNDGNEFDPLKYIYKKSTNEVDIYLNIDNALPCETIENVNNFCCSRNGAAILIKDNELYVKPCTYLNPCSVAFIKLDFNYSYKDIFIDNADRAYIIVPDEHLGKYKIMYIDLSTSTVYSNIEVIDTDISINTPYWIQVVDNRFFLCTLSKSYDKYGGKCTKSDKFYTIDNADEHFCIVEVTNDNVHKYYSSNIFNLFYNSNIAEERS